MSWARVDDGFWNHPKVVALVEAGEWQALSLWILGLSFTNMKGSPDLNELEAALVMRTDRVEARRVMSLLREVALFDPISASLKNTISASEQTPVSASKQTLETDAFHDWDEYRSKDEAKVIAGAQGGRKSGETRRQKSKQTLEAGPKQTTPKTSEAVLQQKREAPARPGPARPGPDLLLLQQQPPDGRYNLQQFEKDLADSGITFHFTSTDRELFAALKPQRDEIAEAIRIVAKKDPTGGPAFVLGCLRKERERAARIRANPPPPRQQSRKPKIIDIDLTKGETLAKADEINR